MALEGSFTRGATSATPASEVCIAGMGSGVKFGCCGWIIGLGSLLSDVPEDLVKGAVSEDLFPLLAWTHKLGPSLVKSAVDHTVEETDLTISHLRFIHYLVLLHCLPSSHFILLGWGLSEIVI